MASEPASGSSRPLQLVKYYFEGRYTLVGLEIMLVNYDGLNRDLENSETNTTYIKKTIIGETQPENINKKIIEESNEPKLTEAESATESEYTATKEWVEIVNSAYQQSLSYNHVLAWAEVGPHGKKFKHLQKFTSEI